MLLGRPEPAHGSLVPTLLDAAAVHCDQAVEVLDGFHHELIGTSVALLKVGDTDGGFDLVDASGAICQATHELATTAERLRSLERDWRRRTREAVRG